MSDNAEGLALWGYKWSVFPVMFLYLFLAPFGVEMGPVAITALMLGGLAAGCGVAWRERRLRRQRELDCYKAASVFADDAE